MKHYLFQFTLILSILASTQISVNAEEKILTNKTDWCEISSPAKGKVGDKITITIKIIKTEPGMLLKGDMHFFDNNQGYKGFAAWGGKGKEVKSGDTVTFTYTLKEDKGFPYVGCVFFLSKDGDFKNAKIKGNSKLITLEK